VSVSIINPLDCSINNDPECTKSPTDGPQNRPLGRPPASTGDQPADNPVIMFSNIMLQSMHNTIAIIIIILQ